jgi:mannose-1-phosphate guanylyltransferase
LALDTVARDVWTIVLAAGEGKRLAAVTGGIPKQFWPAGGGRTLLEETLDRLQPFAPRSRTVVVVDSSHEPYVRALPRPHALGHVLYQPGDRGTAAGVLLALMPVLEFAPDAMVVLTPSDHGVCDIAAFQTGLHEAIARVRAGDVRGVLFGVDPAGRDDSYGWILPARGGRALRGTGLSAIAAFVEKPAPAVAARLLAAGAVWSTMVMVARASTLFGLYHRHLPHLTDVLARAWLLPPGPRERWLADQYPALAAADFSKDVLEAAEGLALFTWPASIGWSDLGTPDRLRQWRGAECGAGRMGSELAAM